MMRNSYELKRRRAARDLSGVLSAVRAAHPHIAWNVAAPEKEPPDPRLATVIELYAAGVKSEDIAERVGLAPGSIHNYIARARKRGDWPADLIRPSGRPKVKP